MKGQLPPTVAVVVGLGIAALAALVALRAGDGAAAIAQTQLVGSAYLLGGTFAWWQRPDNATGPLLVAIAYCWCIPEFQAAAEPAVAGLAYATRRLLDAVSAAFALAVDRDRLASTVHAQAEDARRLPSVPGHDTLWRLSMPDLPQVFAAPRVEQHWHGDLS